MKKTYDSPKAIALALQTEGMVAASATNVTIQTEEKAGASSSLSEGKVWSSDNWTQADED